MEGRQEIRLDWAIGCIGTKEATGLVSEREKTVAQRSRI
jgi:hypothetical protein